ncbi:hypothetical protein MLD52_15520 [Puniceicoccaceae bacterium K14]|nr:hypothetical protein [Puniceicoccaceae bacterium K14]
MNRENTQNKNTLHPISYFFVASGGGVVGTDYASWVNVNPLVGAIIGGIISLVILGVANSMISEKEQIQDFFSGIGSFIGLIVGAVIAQNNSDVGYAWVIGGFFGAGIGYGIGQMIAGLLVFVAFAVLLLSQGPIGLAFRTFIMNLN